mmetsp:Transcript_24895/g.67797  ORF Transcript_24895/g.67797 Transcript_24895/m.67797 type:complete len:153 (+) Transcript_24895:167-625(+)|eukprot:CAMPEP_0202339768 /NCGR_PEP_ID=MMETSP1126-20121109/1488_1 /ASSEMBLY_ACC=CAM_ASM_000457 /TAXON_ID=3047 /ORGANISM="Dunaliella tertiolecta, Strain CCMP1320" /LENGTH=152 /DNA_ID=CAMNT_0048930365 /DNA_START=113 /DNA_END=571 /DNA_ORIENTATION=+
MKNAFVYGTLQAKGVCQALLKRVPASKPASITGYSRFKVKNAVFPAIVPDKPDKIVQGMVLFDLTPHEQHILDVYEAEEYYKTSVQALVQGELVPADVYVFKDEYRKQLLPEEWDYAVWKEQHLAKWLSRLAPGNAHPDMDDCADLEPGAAK